MQAYVTVAAMRAAGLLLFLLGLVACVSGGFLGCGALFGWNGRHAVSTTAVRPGAVSTHTFAPEPGRRYSIALEVPLEPAKDVKMAVVASGTSRGEGGPGSLFETRGWFDPAEPPTLVYGDTSPVAERMLGVFVATSPDPVEIALDLGPNRAGSDVETARLVVYDDALPPQIKRAFSMSGAGAVAAVGGLSLLVVGFFRRRKRSGIRARPVV